jgi:hypothetical protein
MARTQYHVVTSGQYWAVKSAGVVISNHFTKTAAIDAGVVVARAHRPSQLIIHRADGTIEDERTYGDDPFPPRG